MVQAPQIIQPQMLQQNRVIFQQNVMQPQMMQPQMQQPQMPMPPQMQMQMPFLPPKPPVMSPAERQAFINLQRLISTPVGQRLLSNPKVTTKDIMHLIEKDTQQQRPQTPTKQNDQMARAIADRHRENFESSQRDIRDFQKDKDSVQFVDDAKVTEEEEEQNSKEEIEFEFNA